MKRSMIHAFRREEEVRPYSCLASLYDALMDHVDYDAWADYVALLFDLYGMDIRRVIDGGCGTGSVVHALRRMGFEAAGFDRSESMIREARKKVGAPFWVGDLGSPALSGRWNAFLCLYDTIQYLSGEMLESALSEVKNVLTADGLFIFDIVTEAHILRYWIDYTERRHGDGWEVLRRSWYERQARCLHTEFTLASECSDRLYREHHRQSIHKLDELEASIERAGFGLIGRFDGYSTDPANEQSDRIHYLLRKEES